MSAKSNVIAIDIGNSRIKLLRDSKLVAFEYNDDFEIQLIEYLQKCNSKNLLIYSSVNSNIEKVFLSIVRELSFHIISGLDALKFQNMIKHDHIQGMGTDRLMGIFGALSSTKPPLITVDCGTAVTINAIDEQFNCIGGAILPGIQTQLWSLKLRTTKLKPDSINSNPSPAGTNTKDAISSGVIYGITGAIKEIIERISKEYFEKKDIQIYMTGGGAELLLPYVLENYTSIKLTPDLVCRGLIYLFELIKYKINL
jgi:pantothenate kinase type III